MPLCIADGSSPGNRRSTATLIRKFHEAKLGREKMVVLWGSGTPRREFAYSDDMADACIYLMNLPEQQIATAFSAQQPPLFNIGHGQRPDDWRTRRSHQAHRRKRCRHRLRPLEARRHPAQAPGHRETERARMAPAGLAGRGPSPYVREFSEGRRGPRTDTLSPIMPVGPE